jgi:hypothetical protein
MLVSEGARVLTGEIPSENFTLSADRLMVNATALSNLPIAPLRPLEIPKQPHDRAALVFIRAPLAMRGVCRAGEKDGVPMVTD